MLVLDVYVVMLAEMIKFMLPGRSVPRDATQAISIRAHHSKSTVWGIHAGPNQCVHATIQRAIPKASMLAQERPIPKAHMLAQRLRSRCRSFLS